MPIIQKDIIILLRLQLDFGALVLQCVSQVFEVSKPRYDVDDIKLFLKPFFTFLNQSPKLALWEEAPLQARETGHQIHLQSLRDGKLNDSDIAQLVVWSLL